MDEPLKARLRPGPVLRGDRWRAMAGGALGGALAAALVPGWGSPALPVTPLAVPSLVLSNYLLEPPSGYRSRNQALRKQTDPVPLTRPEQAQLFSPSHPSLYKRDMGWTRRNRSYWATIPPEARDVPPDLSSLPALRFDNLEVHGVRELRWRSHGPYDQWFLHDRSRKLHAVLAIHRQTRRTYMFEYRREGSAIHPGAGKDSCYSCHPSGPRLIRTYALPQVDPRLLAAFNARLLSYGAADFGDDLDPARLGPALDDARCTGCHDGRSRGRLYQIHTRTMAYYLKELAAMPLGDPLPPAECDRLLYRQYSRWKERAGRM